MSGSRDVFLLLHSVSWLSEPIRLSSRRQARGKVTPKLRVSPVGEGPAF